MGSVEECCDSVLLLDGGQVVDIDTPEAIVPRYEELTRRPAPRSRLEPAASGAAARNGRPTLLPALVRRGFAAVGDLMSPVQLPSLLRGDARRFVTVTQMLAVTDFRVKYLGTVLSYAWAYLRPAIFFAVMLFVFGALGRFRHGVAHYPAYLVLGIAFWTFFIQTTTASLYSLTRRAPLLRKLPFPRFAVPLSAVAASAFDLAVNLVVAFCVILLSGVSPRLTWLEALPLIAIVVLLATGMGLLLSATYVRYRDLDQVWSVVGQTIFYLTPVFYVITTLPNPYRRVMILANPLAAVMTQARHALIDPTAPTAATVAGGYPFALIPVAVVLGLLGVGYALFKRESPKAPEYV
jgi:ABC-2 type transport system permease protein